MFRTRKMTDHFRALGGWGVLLVKNGGRSEGRRRSPAVHELARRTRGTSGRGRPTGCYRPCSGKCCLPRCLSPPYQRLAGVGRPHQHFLCPVDFVPVGQGVENAVPVPPEMMSNSYYVEVEDWVRFPTSCTSIIINFILPSMSKSSLLLPSFTFPTENWIHHFSVRNFSTE